MWKPRFRVISEGGIVRFVPASFETVPESLINNLCDTSTRDQQESFASLATYIRMNSSLRTRKVIQLIESLLRTGVKNSRGESRRFYSAEILAYGALVRGGRIYVTDDPSLFNTVFSVFISLSMKRMSLLILATAFICELLEQRLPEKSLNELNCLISHYKSLNPYLLKIALVANKFQPAFQCPLLEDMEDITDALTTNALPEDSNYFDFLFNYLSSSDRMPMFWEMLIPKLNQQHLELLFLLIEKAVQKEVTPSLFICRQVITLLLSFFRKQNREFHVKATTAFHQILLYIAMPLNQTERSDYIKLLFTGTPNVLHEYKFLHSSLRTFLSFLSPEDLGLLVEICTPFLKVRRRGRSTISIINFLTRIAQIKNTESTLKIKILNSLFSLGFCTKSTSETDINFDTTIKKSREAFRTVVKSTYDISVVDDLHQAISSIVTNQNTTDVALAVPLATEALNEWKKMNRLSTSTDDKHMSACIKINALLLLLDPPAAPYFIEKLQAVYKDTKKRPMTSKTAGLVSFVLDTANDDRSILNIEAFISQLLKEELIQEESIQFMVDAIEAENASDENECHDDEDNSSDDQDAVSEDIPQVAEADDHVDMTFSNFASNKNDSESSDGESSIDMDDASDSELSQLDATLSQIIARQSGKKQERHGGVKNLLRTLRLVELVFKRYKIPNANIVLMLLMPCLTCLVKCSKIERRASALHRISAVVKRISCIKKVTGSEAIDTEIVNSLLQDVEITLKKKLSKNVRQLLQGIIGMLAKCFQTVVTTKLDNPETNGTNSSQQGKKRKSSSSKLAKTKVAKSV